jgi:type VI secretion system protein ImpA
VPRIRLQVRDVERAFAHPRPSDALAPESVTRQLDDLRALQPAAMAGFDEALLSLAAIEAWSREHLGGYTPDLSALTRLLRHLGARATRDPIPDGENPETVEDNEPSVNEAQDADDALLRGSSTLSDVVATGPSTLSIRRRTGTAPADRHAALELIREARQWFETHEASSPIPLLLKRAEQFVGKRYSEAVQAIPAELLAQWEGED